MIATGTMYLFTKPLQYKQGMTQGQFLVQYK